MSQAILTTKLFAPAPRSNLIPRHRLWKKLNQGLDLELILIAAPAGYGKTTLLSNWLFSLEPPIAQMKRSWLSLDENDNDPQRFLSYLITALQKVEQHIGQAAISLMQSPHPPQPEAILTSLINDIAEVKQPFIFVIDDYHLIHTIPIHQHLVFLLEHKPSQLKLVIVSREDPPFPLARLRARGQIVEIRQDELRFSLQECGDFLQQAIGLDLSDSDIAALEERTEGWAAGLRLAASAIQALQSKHGRANVDSFIQSFTGSNRFILDYLLEEVFSQQDPLMQEFLLNTSILEQLSAPLCDAVTMRSDSHQRLLALDQANLFIEPLDQSRSWYRYHRLFAELLRNRLRSSGERLENILHERACRWYEANGLLLQAVKHALAAEDWTESAHVIGLAAEDIVRDGQIATLHGWLETLPERIVRGDYKLAIFKGWTSLLMGDIETAGMFVELAGNLLTENASSSNKASLTVLRSSLALMQQDIPNALELSQQSLELIGDSNPFLIRGMVLNNLAQSQLLAGDLPAATATYQQMIYGHPDAGKSPTTVSAQANLAWLYHQGGQRRKAVRLCKKALAQCVDSRGRPLPLAGYLHAPLAVLYYETNEFELAYEHACLGREFGEQLGIITGIPVSCRITLAQIQHARGDTEAAQEAIDEIRQLALKYQMPHVEYPIASLEADMSLWHGDLTLPESWSQNAGLAPEDIPNQMREGEYFTLARLLIAQRRLSEADTLLTNFESYANSGGRRRCLITVYLLRALCQKACSRNQQALAYMGDALVLAAPEGYRRAFLDEDPSLINLLPDVRQLAPDFVDSLLVNNLVAQGDRRTQALVQPLVEPLSERELEVLRLVADGLSNREIAQLLVISVGTVKTHAHNIYGKLDVRGRTQAIARARELDLI